MAIRPNLIARMTANSSLHHRRSIRLKGYDYTSEGGYFITLVTYQRLPLFGDVVEGEMRLNDLGIIAREEWFRTAQMRPYVELFDDEFVVMPNHIHGIIWLTDLVGRVGAYCNTPLPPQSGITPLPNPTPLPPQSDNTPLPNPTPLPPPTINPLRSPGVGVGAIIRGYKSAVTKRINGLLNTHSSPVWQRNYYEHIITTDCEYESIVEYIDANPRTWLTDTENPDTAQ